MTTRALVPNADGEGSLGIEGLNWGAMYVSSPEKDDNSQKVPTTAWVQKLLADAWLNKKRPTSKPSARQFQPPRRKQSWTPTPSGATTGATTAPARPRFLAVPGKPFLLVIRSLPRAPEVTLSALLRTKPGKNTANGNINSPPMRWLVIAMSIISIRQRKGPARIVPGLLTQALWGPK